MILGQTNAISANTVYEERGSEVFGRPQEGFYQLFTDEQTTTGQQIGLELFGPSPEVMELTGDRQTAALREYLKTAVVKPYTTKMLELDKSAVDGDVTGAMGRRLTDYLAGGPYFWDQIATDLLLTNPTGVDGVALLHDSHPYGEDGGTWDNKVTTALSFTSFDAGITSMESLVGENGQPLRLSPTHLMVGPALQRTALEITGAQRPVPFSASAQDASSSIVAVSTIENVYVGRVVVVVNPRMTSSTDWLLMDLSRPGVRPIAMGVLEQPHAVAVTDPQSEPVRMRSKYAYYCEGRAAIAGFLPHGVHGRLG
jgi:hypothetical protein